MPVTTTTLLRHVALAGLGVSAVYYNTKHQHLRVQRQDDPTPKFADTMDAAENPMPPPGATLTSIINLSVQFFVVYTCLAIARTVNQLYGTAAAAQKLFESATLTVNYAPMLCVLFLGCRMRAEQLTAKQTSKYGLPTAETQQAMTVAAWAVLIQLIMVLAIPVFTGELSVPVDADGNVDVEKLAARMNKTVSALLSLIRYVTLFALYGAAAYVVYGIHTMEAPIEIFPDGTPPVSPAVGATINLTSQFFIIYLLLAFSKTYVSFAGPGPSINKFIGSLQLAAFTVNMAPMLCILFIGARMRALQIDPINGAPQPWAQNCFWACAYSILVQALIVILLPYTAPGATAVRGDFEGDVKFQGLTGGFATLLSLIRYCALFGLYGGFMAVCYSVFTIEAPNPADTPKLSPAMQCVMNLSVQYFFVYGLLFIAQTIRNANGSEMMGKVAAVMDAARATVMYAPMLSVIFIGSRMRALQLAITTENKIPSTAGPPVWVQECMFLSTWSVLIQLILVIVLSCLYTVEMDVDGNVKPPKDTGLMTGYILNTIRYLSMIAMYGGSCAIMYGTYNMTPSTVQPYMSEPLHPSFPVPSPMTPDDVPAPAVPGA